MIDQVWNWINQGIDAGVSWVVSIGEAVGFPLWQYLIAATILCIVLAYLVLPAVGKSDEASSPEFNDFYSEYRRNKFQ